MSSGFSIPGLGEAKPNEKLPVANFAPDALIAAASQINGEKAETNGSESRDGEAMSETLARTQGLSQTHRQDHAQAAAELGSVVAKSDGHEAMDIDKTTDISQTTTTGSTIKSQFLSSAEPPPEKSLGIDAKAAETQLLTTQENAPNTTGDSHVIDALDSALLAMTQPMGQGQTESQNATSAAEQGPEPAGGDGEGPEWEVDSSPYGSSSESSSSSDDSSDEDDSEAEALDLDETVRMLMAGADGSDDEGDGGEVKGGKGGQVRSKNEQPEWIPPKPDLTITPEMEISLLGSITNIVGDAALITAKSDGEEQVLDVETVVCRSDRSVIAAIADVIGNVLRPMYVLRFHSAEELEKEDLTQGMDLYYLMQNARVVLTKPLRRQKGCDASNLHDEEVPSGELEFSDDEQEQAYKRGLKAKKRSKSGKGTGKETSTWNGPASSWGAAGDAAGSAAGGATGGGGLNYDDEDDGPYRPLARPANFGMGAPPPVPPATGGVGSNPGGAGAPPHRGGRRESNNRGSGRGGGRGGGGHRGGRGGGYRGGRGYSDGYSKQAHQGRHHDHHDHHSGRPQSPPAGLTNQSSQQQPSTFPWAGFPPPPLPPTFHGAPQQTFQQGMPPVPPPHFPFPNLHAAAAPTPPPPPPPPALSGLAALYSNPAFLNALQQQVQQQQQQAGQPQGQQGYQGHQPNGWGQNSGS